MMYKWSYGLPLIILIVVSCNQKTPTPAVLPPEHKSEFFPVSEFFLGELNTLDSLPVTPLKISTVKNHLDSQWIKKNEVYHEAHDFFEPVIDSAHQAEYFSERSFLDQTINLYTLSYEPRKVLPAGSNITRWDVYIDPKTEKVARVYIVKKVHEKDGSITKHLTWIAGTAFTITTIAENKNQNPVIQEEKVIWKFN